MLTKTVDIYPIRAGSPTNPNDFASWLNLQNAIVPDGGTTFGMSALGPGSSGNTGRFMLSVPDFPKGASISRVELHAIAAVDLVENSSWNFGIWGFVLPDGSAPSINSERVQITSATFASISINITGSCFAFFRDNPDFLRWLSISLVSGRTLSTKIETFKIDSFFLRVTYTYDEENQQPNLVRNGFGEEESNSNFSAFTFDRSDALPGTRGSFLASKFTTTYVVDDLIQVEPSKYYVLSAAVKASPYVPDARFHLGLQSYDIDRNTINVYNVQFVAGTTTPLTQPLKIGDTSIQVASSSNWTNSSTNNNVIVWGYRDSTGRVYPPETYSRWVTRSIIGSIDSPTVIGLNKPWTLVNPDSEDGSWPIGTLVGNSIDGAVFQYYLASNIEIPQLWTRYTAVLRSDGLRYGARFVQVSGLLNRNVAGGGTLLSSIYFGDVPVREIDSILPATANLQASIVRAATPEADLFSNANLNADLIRAQLIAAGLEVTGNLQADLTRAQLLAAGLTVEGRLTAELFRVLPEIRDPHFVIHPNNPKLTVS